jgi:hypothetical protein
MTPQRWAGGRPYLRIVVEEGEDGVEVTGALCRPVRLGDCTGRLRIASHAADYTGDSSRQI